VGGVGGRRIICVTVCGCMCFIAKCGCHSVLDICMVSLIHVPSQSGNETVYCLQVCTTSSKEML